MGKNKIRGVITMTLGLVLIIAALVLLLFTRDIDWAAGALIGIGVTDVVFGVMMLFQPTKEDIIKRYADELPNVPRDNDNKETVQFVTPESFGSDAAGGMSFDPNTGEPLK